MTKTNQLKRTVLVLGITLALVATYAAQPARGFATEEASVEEEKVELTATDESSAAEEATQEQATNTDQSTEATAEEATEAEGETLVVQSEESSVAAAEGTLTTQSEKTDESAVAAESTTGAVAQLSGVTSPTVVYRTHVQDIGWQDWKTNGSMAGTAHQSRRLEAIEIAATVPGVSGGIRYKTHVQDIGWQDWCYDGAMAGTAHQSKRLEAIYIELTGDLATKYDVYYRVHVQDYGWQDWVMNGDMAGTAHQSKRLEAIEIKLEKKESLSGAVNYKVHAQDYGWLNWVADGDTGGTTGKSKRLEAVKIALNTDVTGVSGGITYRTHVQDHGWMSWVSNGTISGTTGQSKRMECIEIKLTGDMASRYDVYYQAHIQNGGWLGWACNGQPAGSTGKSLRLEAVRIKLVEKDGDAPGTTTGYMYEPTVSVPIMGSSKATRADCVKHFNSISTYPSSVYSSKGAATITDFINILFEEAETEGVRADVVYAQAMLETNYLRFGGDVSASQCNFAGIGATGGGVSGNSFADVRTGLRAQVQHLKAYASTDPLVNDCVDPRFNLVTRGIAPTLGGLSQRWATGSAYGESINAILQAVDSLS